MYDDATLDVPLTPRPDVAPDAEKLEDVMVMSDGSFQIKGCLCLLWGKGSPLGHPFTSATQVETNCTIMLAIIRHRKRYLHKIPLQPPLYANLMWRSGVQKKGTH